MDMNLKANSKRQWRTEEPGMLQSMDSQRVRHDLAMNNNNIYLYVLNCKSALYISYTRTYQLYDLQITPPFCMLYFYLPDGILWSTNIFNFSEVQFIYFFLVTYTFGIITKNPLLVVKCLTDFTNDAIYLGLLLKKFWLQAQHFCLLLA